ncbi:MAG: MCE family protein [Candidatus Omnitrophica bacterium]|nr:MCE family protein [Candidatus Omnitrophota bacterium]
MPRESNLELKVGIFIVLAIACLVAFIFSISDFSIFKGGRVYRAVFTYANGLKKSAPVRIAGVDAGHVRSIRAYLDRQSGRVMVDVEAWIDDGIAVPVDSVFMVNQLGLLGEKYLEILPGTSTALLAPGSRVAGEDPVAMETVMKRFATLSGKMEALLNGLNDGILNESNKQALAVTLANVASLTGKLDSGVLTAENQQALSSLLASLAAVTDKVNRGEGTIGKFLADPSVYNNLDELSADLKVNPWKLFYRPKAK